MYSCGSDRVVYDDPKDPKWQYPGEYADISGADTSDADTSDSENDSAQDEESDQVSRSAHFTMY